MLRCCGVDGLNARPIVLHALEFAGLKDEGRVPLISFVFHAMLIILCLNFHFKGYQNYTQFERSNFC